MSWNFRLELPELSTRTFICPTTNGPPRAQALALGGLACLVRPLPAGNIGPIGTVLVSVVPAGDLLVVKFRQGRPANPLQSRNVLNHIHGQGKAIDLILDRQFQRSI